MPENFDLISANCKEKGGLHDGTTLGATAAAVCRHPVLAPVYTRGPASMISSGMSGYLLLKFS